MQKLIDTSTAFYGAGNALGARLFTVSSGPWTGRQIAIYATSPTTIKFSVADFPYSSWSSPQTIATNAADYPVSGCMDGSGNVYLAYSAQTTLDLLFRKLTYNSGEWSVGSEVIIYNDKDNYIPTILKTPANKIFVCWTSYDSASGNYFIRAKTSTSDGAVWGAGPADAGTALTTGSISCYATMVFLSPYIYSIYTDASTELSYRRISEGAALWDPEVTLYTGIWFGDYLSAAAGTAGSIVGVAFSASGKLWYMEYDTFTWSGAYELAAAHDTSPVLFFNGAIPYVMYGVSVGTGQIEMKYRYKSGAGFAAEKNLDLELQRFTQVFLYDADAGSQFHSVIAAAGDSAAADVFHPTSGKLIQAVNDAIYLGADEKFVFCQALLSTIGAGAVISWSYYNGSAWTTFTPLSGDYHFDQAAKLVRLWNDSVSAPSDWQKTVIALKTKFWIKVTVTTAFTTAPIGTQLTPLSSINHITH